MCPKIIFLQLHKLRTQGLGRDLAPFGDFSGASPVAVPGVLPGLGKLLDLEESGKDMCTLWSWLLGGTLSMCEVGVPKPYPKPSQLTWLTR
jgi:hypothetical protein